MVDKAAAAADHAPALGNTLGLGGGQDAVRRLEQVGQLPRVQKRSSRSQQLNVVGNRMGIEYPSISLRRQRRKGGHLLAPIATPLTSHLTTTGVYLEQDENVDHRGQ